MHTGRTAVSGKDGFLRRLVIVIDANSLNLPMKDMMKMKIVT